MDATDKRRWPKEAGGKTKLPIMQQEKERGDYRETDKERHRSSKRKVRYPGFLERLEDIARTILNPG